MKWIVGLACCCFLTGCLTNAPYTTDRTVGEQIILLSIVAFIAICIGMAIASGRNS